MIEDGLNGSIFKIDDNDSFINSINYWLSKVTIPNEYLNRRRLTTIDAKDEVKKIATFLDTI